MLFSLWFELTPRHWATSIVWDELLKIILLQILPLGCYIAVAQLIARRNATAILNFYERLNMRPLPHDILPNRISKHGEICKKTQKEDVIEWLEAVCESVLVKWEKLKAQAGETGKRKINDKKKINNKQYSSHNEYLRMSVYRIGVVLIENEQLKNVRELFEDEPYRRKGTPSVTENIFHWILHYMLADQRDKLSMTVRNRIAKQLLYAYWHRVPAYFLTGFIYQLSNADNIIEKINNDEREYWFDRLVYDDGEDVNIAGHY